MAQWNKVVLNGVPGWRFGSFTVCLNRNMGLQVLNGHTDRHGHRWWYEVCLEPEVLDIAQPRCRTVGIAYSLARAKQLAEEAADGR